MMGVVIVLLIVLTTVVLVVAVTAVVKVKVVLVIVIAVAVVLVIVIAVVLVIVTAVAVVLVVALLVVVVLKVVVVVAVVVVVIVAVCTLICAKAIIDTFVEVLAIDMGVDALIIVSKMSVDLLMDALANIDVVVLLDVIENVLAGIMTAFDFVTPRDLLKEFRC